MNPRAAKRWVAGEPTVDEPATPVALDAPAAIGVRWEGPSAASDPLADAADAADADDADDDAHDADDDATTGAADAAPAPAPAPIAAGAPSATWPTAGAAGDAGTSNRVISSTSTSALPPATYPSRAAAV